ncbi:DUF47 family protein [Candidatus Roizmanbacteria bacterium]|nr:DUF47 family protein [Candidatus Roizmanbacteria bacterium]
MGLFPKTIDFFARLSELATVMKEISLLLKKIKIPLPKDNSFSKKARQLELKADALCHKIQNDVNVSFITPIDREDIYNLADNLDTVVDLIENLISNLAVYSIKKEEKEFREFITLITSTTQDLVLLIQHLKHREKNIKEMRNIIVRINRDENLGDQLIRKAYMSLFSNHTNAVDVIKWKDIYTNMEGILDASERLAHLVEEIIIKNY